MLRLVPVRVRDVAEVDVERRAGSITVVGRLERRRERVDVGVRAVARRVHVREVEHGPDEVDLRRDREHVVDACRGRARVPSPRSRTARAGPSPRAARAGRRAGRRRRRSPARARGRAGSPGWKTITSAPAAFARPAVWSSMPSAILNFFSRSTWPMNAASGACTESDDVVRPAAPRRARARRRSRARSRRRSRSRTAR